MLHNIRIVLIETSHTGNMGSTARAMKTMGLNTLYLVNPLVAPDSQAISLAAGASDIIGNAIISKNLDEAIADCQLVMGTSARSRTLEWPLLQPRGAAEKMIAEAKAGPVALLFGRERVGLTNEELQKCHYHITIPASPDYSSLNLAMAVQILAYELHLANGLFSTSDSTSACPSKSTDNAAINYPRAGELEQFYQHLQQILLQIAFIRPAQPGQVLTRLRRMINRARPDSQELNILRGILSAISKSHDKLK